MTRVKVCGITRPDDAAFCAASGVDAIGMVFYPPSPRHVADLGLAREIAQSVGPFVNVVALVVNAEVEYIDSLIEQLPISAIQFHGEEQAAFCDQFQRPYIKALRVGGELHVASAMAAYPDAQGILLDAYVKGTPGGTGQRFDWKAIPEQRPRPLILAGGLSVDNVAEAIAQVQPYAVDVSGGVEASPGQKDAQKISDFIGRVCAMCPQKDSL